MRTPGFEIPEAAVAPTAELLTREAEFLTRRRRVARALASIPLTLVLGVGFLLAARELAPDAFDVAVALLVLGLAASCLQLWRVHRRHWRCPDCGAGWDLKDGFASAHWNHCQACGVPLRAAPAHSAVERTALREFEELPSEELVKRFVRRRRWGMAGALGVFAAGLAALLWSQGRGWGGFAQNAVVAAFAGLVTAIVMLSARCPRCRIGIVAGRDRHCQRCGLLLRPGAQASVSGATGPHRR
jgi:uncharacterized protein (DUF983 family)